MNAKATIRRLFFITLWFCIGGGLVILLAAAMQKQKSGRCSGLSISIRGGGPVRFLDRAELAAQLRRTAGGELAGKPLSAFRLDQLEAALIKNPWVEEAQLYFDSRNLLHLNVKEKTPIARLFTVSGDSYYIDSFCSRLPLSDRVSARVPLFTGFPDRRTWLKKDSLLAREVRTIALYVLRDPFWNAQVAQIDITPERKFEMVPLLGNHLVKLGDAADVEKKFHRLFLFYRNVLRPAGFSRYPVIDVQYRGQIVATRVNEKKTVDSVQLRKNVEKLLQPVRAEEPKEQLEKTVREDKLPATETRVPKAVMPRRLPDAIITENVP
ncbi:MAG TPA: hypothetical protein VEB63_02825 [Chitinophagaceae bacterium]|nr:hypothetical protein [Chitinophagaceae bacterium]